MIKVLADKNLVNIADFLPANVKLQLYEPDSLAPHLSDDVDALLVRTVTKINPKTFPSFPKSLRFIGTGSAGTDHVDIPYLNRNDIAFANAAGCNARSVGEYVAVGMLLWAEERNIDLNKQTVGIVGMGHTGSAVQDILNGMGVATVGYDPPREQREEEFTSSTLDEVLDCPILTFHTPLTTDGPHPTFHWLEEEKLKAHQFKLLINAARGGIIDENALLKAKKRNGVGDYILDVWEEEPLFDDEVAEHAFIKTPHIAGYSVQAKERATRMIVQAMQEHLPIEMVKANPSHQATESIRKSRPSSFWSLTDVLTHYHPIRDYETRMLMLMGRNDDAKEAGFNKIRTHHPLRNELIQFDGITPLFKQFPIIHSLFN